MPNKETRNDPEKLAFMQAGVLLVNFIKKQNWKRTEVAAILGIHHNSLYKDELILEEWCDHYNSQMRRTRLDLYQVWLLLFTRCLVNQLGTRKQAETFIFKHPGLTTHEKFIQTKQTIIKNYGNQPRQIKRVLAA
jgi:hypothetical protein